MSKEAPYRHYMQIPSHIGPNGLSPVQDHTKSSNYNSDSDPIELRTPPKTIKLDDSNIWVTIGFNAP